MKIWLIFLAITVSAVFITGCSSGTTPTETPLVSESATIEPSETIAPTNTPPTNLTTVPVSEIQNIIWLWQSFNELQTGNQTIVTNPSKYNLVFLEDGTFRVQADCNNLQGTYQVNGSELQLLTGISTLAECGSESLYDQFIQQLQNVSLFGIQNGNLVLQLSDASGLLTFSNGGIFSTSPGRPCDAAIDPANVKINTQPLAQTNQPICVYGTPYNPTQPPGPTGLPDHLQILLSQDDPAQVKPNDPIITIIPIKEYEELWQQAGNPIIIEEIEKLRQLLLDKPDPVISAIPIFPFERVTGTQDIQSNVKYTSTQKATGVRFISRFSQGPNPLTRDNPQLFYVFQGISFDGQYVVSFFYPVMVPSLPASSEVNQEEMSQVEGNYTTYLATKNEQLNALQTNDFNPDLAVLDQVIQSLDWSSGTPVGETPLFANISWQWAELNQTGTVTQTFILDPYNYTITYAPDGSIGVRADCNNASGSYSVNGTMMSIQLGVTTQAACPEGSRSEQFLSLLSQVNQYAIQGGRLVLDLQAESGSIVFNNGGLSVVLLPPVPGIPTATAKVAINVRGGPGTQFPSYGVAAAGSQAEIIGKSQDGGWWVIRLPAGYSPDNTGWVSAEFIDASNADTVSVIPSPPSP